jgi:betaine-aldehyde dehydrogenase
MSQIKTDRRQHIIASAIAVLAEYGIVEFTFNKVAQHAGVSAALLVHYFATKEALLEAAFRSVVRQLNQEATARVRLAAGPRARIEALVDAHLGHNDFSEETARVWLSFWGQALHVPQLARVQRAHQQRMLSNLKFDLRRLVDARDILPMAHHIAAMIDGVWLRAAMNGGAALQNGLARDLIFDFIARNVASTQAAPAASHFDTINPATGQLLATIRIDGQAEVDKAVARAAHAQSLWARTPGVERGRILHRAAALLVERNDVLARLETQDTGKPIQETSAVDVISGADCIEYYAGLARSIAGEHHDLGTGAFGYTRREPLGVVAGIGAWNYPIQIACWKSAPALACGNAMIFKPAELTPLTAIELEKVYLEAGLPDGLFQVVQGKADTGRLLSRHPGIAKVSLTGEVGTGKKVMVDAAGTLKYVTFELGGKSALIIFEDADLDEAVSGALLANFYSAGEVCTNGAFLCTKMSVMLFWQN